jgi:hypothetical protein
MMTKTNEGTDWGWQSGTGESVQIGAVNRNGQRCCGHRGVTGTDHGQLAYKVDCTRCGYVYGANGSDMHERRCPVCDGGAAGIRFWAASSR